MMRKMPEFREQMMGNGAYKIVALIASVILWLTVLGQKDVVMMKDFNIEFLVQSKLTVSNEGENRVRVKVKGPRMALKKFSQIDESIIVNLYENGPGKYAVRIPKEGSLDLPLGVRVISIEPDVMNVTISRPKE